MKQRIVIMGGGTFSHVRSHLALSTPAFGNTARFLADEFKQRVEVLDMLQRIKTSGDRKVSCNLQADYSSFEIELILTKMADPSSNLVTNDDVKAKVEELIKDPTVRAIIFNVAMTDYTGVIGEIESGKHAERLETSTWWNRTMHLTPAEKVIGLIRKERKDMENDPAEFVRRLKHAIFTHRRLGGSVSVSGATVANVVWSGHSSLTPVLEIEDFKANNLTYADQIHPLDSPV